MTISTATIEPRIVEIARQIASHGGRAVLVGGWVRDLLLGIDSKDADIEVFGIDAEQLESVLEKFGEVITVGRAFGVMRLKGLDLDFSLPRKDSKVAVGHRGFRVEVDPGLDFETAARRRDLTINSIGMDVLTGDLLDPHHGQDDLRRGVLRATDPAHFREDPLRGLRAAQFAARLGMHADAELLALCRDLDLREVSQERIFDELAKLLLKGVTPSIGLRFLEDTALLRFFPELDALRGVAQDPEWHPEGDVWIHTLMVVDEAARSRRGTADDLCIMLGALCHDLGKPLTTVYEHGRVRSPGHDVAGLGPTETLLGRIRAPHRLTRQVKGLVQHHLAPALFIKNGATAKAYRRLARKLEQADLSFDLLTVVATADHFGRTTAEALAREFDAGEKFLQAASELDIRDTAPSDTVLGRHLIERGLSPGPHFKQILERCRDIQDETGCSDPDTILHEVLGLQAVEGLDEAQGASLPARPPAD